MSIILLMNLIIVTYHCYIIIYTLNCLFIFIFFENPYGIVRKIFLVWWRLNKTCCHVPVLHAFSTVHLIIIFFFGTIVCTFKTQSNPENARMKSNVTTRLWKVLCKVSPNVTWSKEDYTSASFSDKFVNAKPYICFPLLLQ